MHSFSLQAKIKEGKLYFSRRFFDFQLSKLKDGPADIIIEKRRSTRTIQQNRYYWLCIEIICETTGYSPEEQHEIFKKLYLPKRNLKWRGREVEIGGSTTDLSKGEFISYMQFIQREAGEMGIILPLPEEYFRKPVANKD